MLEVLCKDLNHKSCVVSGVGRFLYSQKLENGINNYNSVVKYFEDHPEVQTIEVLKPIFMTGLPRSGSTFMHKLLAEDPNCRGLCNWEIASSPVPPTKAEEYLTDPRIAATQEQRKPEFRVLF